MNFFNIGPMELLLVLTVVLIVFGPDKIPDIAGSIGKSLRKFRDASKEISDEFDLEDLSPSSIANALEANAASKEKSEQQDGDSESLPALPALPAAAGPAETPAPAPVAAPVDVAEAEQGEAPKRRFHLPPAETEAVLPDDAAPNAATIATDHESSEDAD